MPERILVFNMDDVSEFETEPKENGNPTEDVDVGCAEGVLECYRFKDGHFERWNGANWQEVKFQPT